MLSLLVVLQSDVVDWYPLLTSSQFLLLLVAVANNELVACNEELVEMRIREKEFVDGLVENNDKPLMCCDDRKVKTNTTDSKDFIRKKEAMQQSIENSKVGRTIYVMQLSSLL